MGILPMRGTAPVCWLQVPQWIGIGRAGSEPPSPAGTSPSLPDTSSLLSLRPPSPPKALSGVDGGSSASSAVEGWRTGVMTCEQGSGTPVTISHPLGLITALSLVGFANGASLGGSCRTDVAAHTLCSGPSQPLF